ncbi:MAG: NADH oxidase, partial [Actinomycetota bacterium]
MSDQRPTTTRELVSTLTEDGTITFSQRSTDLRELGPDDVLVRVEAAPINPSDLGLMFAGADPSTATTLTDGVGVSATVTAGLASMTSRFGMSLPCGNEGAGTVVATGDAPEAAAL